VKPLPEQTLYEILEVPPDAPAGAIVEAVERAQALYAPGSLATYTLLAPDEAEYLSRRIEEARATLLDPAARARYDQVLLDGAQPPHGPPAGAPNGSSRAPPIPTWPELPPVIPALKEELKEEDEAAGPEDDLDGPDVGDIQESPVLAAPRTLAPPPSIAAPQRTAPSAEPSALPVAIAVVAVPPAGVAAPAPPLRAVPILLSREVGAPPAPPSAPVPAAAAPRVPPVPEPPASAALPATFVPEGTTWTGEVLRKIREARGISVQQIAERTKVGRYHIEHVEEDHYHQLPAAVYLRGILLSIARELRLDGQKVARSYLERMAAAGPPPPPASRGR
jgi:hypothetical protein